MDEAKLLDWIERVCCGQNTGYNFPCNGATEWVLQVGQNSNGKWEATAYEYRIFCSRFLNLPDSTGARVFDTEQECTIAAFRKILDICSEIDKKQQLEQLEQSRRNSPPSRP